MRLILSSLIILVLAGCADPVEVGRIRPGIGSDVDLDAIRPPSGVVYNFSVEQGGLPTPAALTLRSRRTGSDDYEYRGAMVLRVPGDPVELQEIAKILGTIFKADVPRVRGNDIFIPMTIRTDSRFRSKSSTLLGDDDRFVPHDCFAVLGRCAFTAIRTFSAGERKIDLVADTTESNGIWRSIIRGSRNNNSRAERELREIQTYSLDKNGVVIDLAINREGAAAKDILVFKRR